jgi:hypothetical protein
MYHFYECIVKIPNNQVLLSYDLVFKIVLHKGSKYGDLGRVQVLEIPILVNFVEDFQTY